MRPIDWALRPFQQYADFSGRAPRAEYWWFTVFYWFASLIAQLIDLLLSSSPYESVGMIGHLLMLGFLIPSLAVTVRRLHDINRSGWDMLRYWVPIFVLAILTIPAMFLGFFGMALVGIPIIIIALKFLVLMATEGSRGPNLYGLNPYGLGYGY